MVSTSERMWNNVRELVEQVPAELLRHEVLNTAALHDLWQLRGVSKSVGQPELFTEQVKILFEERLADDELATSGAARV